MNPLPIFISMCCGAGYGPGQRSKCTLLEQNAAEGIRLVYATPTPICSAVP